MSGTILPAPSADNGLQRGDDGLLETECCQASIHVMHLGTDDIVAGVCADCERQVTDQLA